MKFSKGFKICVVIILISFAVIFMNIFKQKESIRQAEFSYKRVEIPFVQPSVFTFWNKSEIISRRIKAVENCPLKPENYFIKSEIYSGIDQRFPWFLSAAHYSSSSPVNSATPIENPMLLVDFVHPYTFMNCPEDKTRGLFHFLSLTNVSKIIYTPETNTIDVFYDVAMYDLKRLNKNLSKFPYRFSLTGVNARDFGYEYVKADSLENVKMLAFTNISNSMYKFKDYYGLGGKSYIKVGSFNNQILPHQPELDFRITKLPARIKLKLYKNPKDKECINYNLHFYNSFTAGLSHYKKKAARKFPKVKNMSFEEFHKFYYENMEKIEK